MLVDAVLGEERIQVGVAAGLHLLELRGGPGIHPHRAHEGDVHAKPAVDAGALEAHEDTVRHRSPLGVLRGAVRADLRGENEEGAASAPAAREKATDAGCSRTPRPKSCRGDAAEGRLPKRSGIPARAAAGARLMRGGSIARDRPAYRSCAENSLSRPAVGEHAYAPRCRAAAVARARWPQPRETPWPRLGEVGRVPARLRRRRALSTSPEHVKPGRVRDACAARSVASDALGSARRTLGHGRHLSTTTSGRTTSEMISATDFLFRCAGTFEETRRLTSPRHM